MYEEEVMLVLVVLLVYVWACGGGGLKLCVSMCWVRGCPFLTFYTDLG